MMEDGAMRTLSFRKLFLMEALFERGNIGEVAHWEQHAKRSRLHLDETIGLILIFKSQ